MRSRDCHAVIQMPLFSSYNYQADLYHQTVDKIIALKEELVGKHVSQLKENMEVENSTPAVILPTESDITKTMSHSV